MKKYIFLTLLFLLPTLGFSSEFKVDETKSDIYFANSILATKKDAKDSLNLIRKNIRMDQYNGNLIKVEKELNFDTAYNQTKGFEADLYETIMQLSDEELTWKMLINVASFVITRGVNKTTKVTKIPPVSDKEKKLYERTWESVKSTFDTILQIQHDIDLSKQVQSYKHSIRQGHKVIVIAHGQGDLFTNEASKEILKPDTLDGVTYQYNEWMRNYFTWISVGTPSSERILPHTVVSFDNDTLAFLSILPKIENPNRYQTKLATGEGVDRTDWEFHKFKYYMGEAVNINDDFKNTNVSTNIAKIEIMQFLKDAIEEHKNAESQWVVDQQIGHGTKEYRLKVTHSADSSLNQYLADKEIYPFAPLKKLYPLPDPNDPNNFVYVKASFGGEKILDADAGDTWEGQKDNQFYKLQGTGEIIEGEICKDPSLFEIISHQNENTADWRVTVKNKDTNETQDNVYPFNLNGSLYKLKSGDWVLASCGGENIVASWGEQKESEFYMIDNPQNEKIAINDFLYDKVQFVLFVRHSVFNFSVVTMRVVVFGIKDQKQIFISEKDIPFSRINGTPNFDWIIGTTASRIFYQGLQTGYIFYEVDNATDLNDKLSTSWDLQMKYYLSSIGSGNSSTSTVTAKATFILDQTMIDLILEK